jgi:site-specific DNA-methyltransferase (adenine-specific)
MSEEIKMELYNDNFQNFKQYNIPKAQLVIADIPYNVGTNFYGSNPEWYNDGDNKNGESEKAGKAAFNTDFNFNIVEYFAFCSKILKPEPNTGNQKRGRSSDAPCMIIFCAFEQLNFVIETAAKYGFKNYIPLIFVKNTSPQVLKANMRIVGATEYALILYRGRLPKFNNDGQMIKNWFNWEYDDRSKIPKVHPTQKPIAVLERLIEIFTDPGDVVIDPCAGSGSTLMAARNLGRHSYGFEVSKPQYVKTCNEFLHLPPSVIGRVRTKQNPQMNLFEFLKENT